MRITDETSLAHAVEQLVLADGDLITAMIDRAGHPPLRQGQADLGGLVRIIIAQQVSTASAEAIHRRFLERFQEAGAHQLAKATDAEFQACGLSLPKIRTLRHLAEALVEGRLEIESLAHMDSDGVRQALTSVKGIGPWTADVYLLFCLGHPDVWPAGDLALQEGVRLALNMRKRPDAAKLEKISRRWRPWRAAAARIIWAYYGVSRTSPPATRKKPQARKTAKAGIGARSARTIKPAR
ncbi:MAG: DNA-3-methyladenine glycosylase 2 family protein [Hyphomicrobiales bacterium]|nr:DNA-3-methyladenine glycosylase 2 family protein [Hyphomicrobiales bacterium]